jgi:hypothetical protein
MASVLMSELPKLSTDAQMLEQIGRSAAVWVAPYTNVAADGGFAGYPLIPGTALEACASVKSDIAEWWEHSDDLVKEVLSTVRLGEST